MKKYINFTEHELYTVNKAKQFKHHTTTSIMLVAIRIQHGTYMHLDIGSIKQWLVHLRQLDPFICLETSMFV